MAQVSVVPERSRPSAVAETTAWDDSEFDRFARIALENGLRVVAANEAWATWAVGQVDPGTG